MAQGLLARTPPAPSPLSRPPSEIFRRQRFISGDPEEKVASYTIDPVGVHSGTWARALERFVAPLSAETRAKVLGGNVKRIYGLGG